MNKKRKYIKRLFTASVFFICIIFLVTVAKLADAALTDTQVQEIASKVTVQIYAKDIRKPAKSIAVGSGVIIPSAEQNKHYVVTNSHVAYSGGEYVVKTFDGTEHTIKSEDVTDLSNVDLDLSWLKFTSSKNYNAVELGDFQDLNTGDLIYIGGWPFNNDNFQLVSGVIRQKNLSQNQTLYDDGYSISYRAQTKNGMSGGPILDKNGHLIGIHGKSTTLYQLGIPISTFIENAGINWAKVPRDNLPPNPSPAIPPNPSPTISPNLKARPIILIPTPLPSPKAEPTRNGEYARNSGNDNNRRNLTDDELKQLAKDITVEVRIIKISGGRETNTSRSGFVVGKERYDEHGFTYKVITYLGQKGEPKNVFYTYQVVGRGGNSIPMGKGGREIATSNGNRLVQIEFFDYKELYYEKAQLGAFDLNVGDKVFASGCKSEEDKATTECDLVEGTVKSIHNFNGSQIYLSDSMKITEEMLGGPLINSKGEVIGINSKQSYHDLVADAWLKNNFSGRAIPTQEFKEYLPRATFSN